MATPVEHADAGWTTCACVPFTRSSSWTQHRAVATYAVWRSGVRAMALGMVPTLIAGLILLVAVSMGTTVFLNWSATYAVSPLGDMAMWTGCGRDGPRLMTAPAVLLAVFTGTTHPSASELA